MLTVSHSCVFPVLAQGFTQNWRGLLICRLFMGIGKSITHQPGTCILNHGYFAGMGVKITTIPIMTSETAPAVIRGGLVMSFQLWVAFGILV